MVKQVKALALAVILQFVFCGAIFAQANVSQLYTSKSKIEPGSLVGIAQNNKDGVTCSNSDNGDRLIGVSVKPTSQALGSQNSGVEVASTGIVTVAVSDLNGDIKAGDQVGVSPIDCVGMKAESASRIIGIAQTDFLGSDSNRTSKITDKNGQASEVKLGSVDVTMSIGYAQKDPQTAAQIILDFGQKVAYTLVGHPVSTLRIILAFIVAVIAIVALGILIYGAARGSLISIGRNPLAKKSIYASLAQVMAMAIALIFVAMGIIYFILR